VFLSKLSSKTPNNLFWKKVDVENVLQKNKKNSMPFFSVICLYCVYGRVSAWGIQKHPKQIVEKSPICFLTGLCGL
jgi:hypothetical protein